MKHEHEVKASKAHFACVSKYALAMAIGLVGSGYSLAKDDSVAKLGEPAEASPEYITTYVNKMIDGKKAAYVLVITLDDKDSKLFIPKPKEPYLTPDIKNFESKFPSKDINIKYLMDYTFFTYQRNPCCKGYSGGTLYYRWTNAQCFPPPTETLMAPSYCGH